MKTSIIKGISFGLTSGIITTLGLMVGMYFGTNSKSVVIGAILIIAIADSLSDALGIHLSEESQKRTSVKGIWESTISAFVTKFIFALTFIIPVIFLKLSIAVTVSVIWGLSLLGIFSYYIAKNRDEKPWKVIFEHLIIAIMVIVATYFVGSWIAVIFG